MKLYLTPEKKAYYMAEFKKAIECTDEYFDLDYGLKDILIAINKNPNVQTLLSKRSEDLDFDWDSYIQFAFSSSIEPKIPNLIKAFKKCFGKNLKFKIFTTGSINLTNDIDDLDNSIKHMDCVANINKYTNIEIVSIKFTSGVPHGHELFWDMVKEYLVGIS
jgi:hypothetical protein